MLLQIKKPHLISLISSPVPDGFTIALKIHEAIFVHDASMRRL